MQIQWNVDERYKVQQRVTFPPAWLPGQQRFTGGFVAVGSLVMLSLTTPYSQLFVLFIRQQITAFHSKVAFIFPVEYLYMGKKMLLLPQM